MDEADRMIDMGFEEDVRTIFSFFQVCILLFINIISHTSILTIVLCSLLIFNLGPETNIVIFSYYAKKNSKFCSISFS